MGNFSILLTMLLIPFSVSAYNGNDLYQWGKIYQSNDTLNLHYGFYMGYVSATAHTVGVLGAFCAPEETTDGQIFDIVYDYVKTHPSKRTDDASVMISHALQEVYPCTK
ncbi:hypothetical protein CIL06_01150 [Pantoea vagans]|uniref:Rap1a/Tai family immunity protein n=1 Tax=Pantoea vagans TaxID=470934 RepID=UPI000BAC8D13|nr:Rap1a/Tai family immunity protein [Pantoea vagans]PAW34407.1 hypothetical protein CIL06_01150 [Pantoea vagans]